MKNYKTRLCVIGTGRAGMIHARNFAKNADMVELTAVVDPIYESLENAKQKLGAKNAFSDYKEALDTDLFDAVVVATPTKYHKDIVIAAAEAGRHIFCEKPMALNIQDCNEMIGAVEKNGVKLQIGFMRRFDKAFMAAKERLEQGEIGDIVQVRSITYGPSTPKPWMYDISKSNGPLAEVNSHDIDTLRWYTGSEFEKVYAIASNYRCPDAKDKFPDFYDNVILTASFENGMQGVVGGAQGVKYGYDSRCEILGTKGIIFVGSLDDCSMVSCSVNGASRPVVKSWANLYEQAYLQEDRHFVECIIEDKQPKVTGKDGRMAVAVVNAGNESIKKGNPVVVR